MTQGDPPAPRVRSIIAGILLASLICLSFALLPSLTKWAGAALTFIPSRLGLIRVVTPQQVMPVDFGVSPTPIVFRSPGRYVLFTDNYDLLVINDGAVQSGGRPWIKLLDHAGNEVLVTLVARGLAFYDTPFARGRPVARFEIFSPGTYSMLHTTRNDTVFVVPDYTFGDEGWIITLIVLQLLAVAYVGWRWWRTRRAKQLAAEAAWKQQFARRPRE
jgi:hypothetical protein